MEGQIIIENGITLANLIQWALIPFVGYVLINLNSLNKKVAVMENNMENITKSNEKNQEVFLEAIEEMKEDTKVTREFTVKLDKILEVQTYKDEELDKRVTKVEDRINKKF